MRALRAFAFAVAGLLAATGIALADPGTPDGGVTVEDGARDAHQHGVTAGHLSASNVTSSSLASWG